MVVDLMWVIGEVFSIAALLYGAYLALMETAPFRAWFGGNSAASALMPERDRRLIDGTGNRMIDPQH